MNHLHIPANSTRDQIEKICIKEFGTNDFYFEVCPQKETASLIAFIANCPNFPKKYDKEGNYLHPYKIEGYYSFSDYHMKNKSIRINRYFVC